MRKLRLSFLGVLLIAIAVGIFWGLRIKKAADIRRAPEADARVLKILALKNALPRPVISKFEASANLKVELVEEPTPDALMMRLEKTSESFDLITLMSTQTSRAVGLKKIQPLKLSEISGSQNVSPDFLDLPGLQTQPSVVPILWGLIGLYSKTELPLTSWLSALSGKGDRSVMLLSDSVVLAFFTSLNASSGESPSAFGDRGKRIWASTTHSDVFLKDQVDGNRALNHGEAAFSPFNESPEGFHLPVEGAPLWVLNLSMGAQADQVSGAVKFIEHVLKPQVASELSILSHQASCNRSVETSPEFEVSLKPSYLRTVPLKLIKAPDDRLIAQALALQTVLDN